MDIKIVKRDICSVLGYSISAISMEKPLNRSRLLEKYRSSLLPLAEDGAYLYMVINDDEGGDSKYFLGIEHIGCGMDSIPEAAGMETATIPPGYYAVTSLPEDADEVKFCNDFFETTLPEKGFIADLGRGLYFERYKSDVSIELWAPIISAEPLRNTLSAFARLEGIDIAPALKRLRGMQKVLETSARATGESIDERIGKAALYLEKGNIEDFAITIHGLKGSLATIGAVSLSEFALMLEKAAKSGDVDYCKKSFGAFEADLKELGERLKEIFGGFIF